jgi:hypothetical protein
MQSRRWNTKPSMSVVGMLRQPSFATIAAARIELVVLFLAHFGKIANRLELCRDGNLTGLIDETPLSANTDGG